jgi:hypothetical protein
MQFGNGCSRFELLELELKALYGALLWLWHRDSSGNKEGERATLEADTRTVTEK